MQSYLKRYISVTTVALMPLPEKHDGKYGRGVEAILVVSITTTEYKSYHKEFVVGTLRGSPVNMTRVQRSAAH